jgi:hypothetical protein
MGMRLVAPAAIAYDEGIEGIWISLTGEAAERLGGQAMLNIGENRLETMERLYPGIRKTVEYYESLNLPRCATCASEDTAKVIAGNISRRIHAASATTKMHLRPNGHPADYFCNTCGQYFDVY